MECASKIGFQGDTFIDDVKFFPQMPKDDWVWSKMTEYAIMGVAKQVVLWTQLESNYYRKFGINEA